MSARRLAGSFWPSRHHELLLVAGLAEQPAALEAWQELRPRLELQTLDDASFVMLPLVYRLLGAAAVDDPLAPRLKGIYRSTWAKNTVLVGRLGASAQACAAASVQPLLVGSIGAALRYYGGLGFRPTPYVELLVPEDAVSAAVAALGRAGWSARDVVRASRSQPLVLVDRGGAACLVRTVLAPDVVLPGAGAAHATLQDAATHVDARGTRVTALAPTDDLLAAIVTGARSAPAFSFQWIVDATMILRSVPEEIDWERLLRIGIESGQGLRLRDALEYLRRLLGLAAPADVQRRLDEMSPGPRERLTHACAARRVRGLGSLPEALGEHLAATADRSLPATIGALPAFFRRRWQLEHNWQLPLAAVQRAYRNVCSGRGRNAGLTA